MIVKEDIIELNSKFYYLSKGFGGGERLYEIISQSSFSPLELERRMHIILSHPNPIHVINPWAGPFHLIPRPRIQWEYDYDVGIDITRKYDVYDINQRHVYSVGPDAHKGYWGRSVLDKLLVKQSYTGDFYYLYVYTYNMGSYVYGLLINNISLKTFSTEAINSPVRSPTEFNNPRQTSIIETANETSFIVIDGIENMHRDENSGFLYPIHIHFLESDPFSTRSRDVIVQDVNTTLMQFEILNQNRYLYNQGLLTINLDKSGWLVLSQVKPSGELLPLNFASVSGLGGDRILKESNGLWYVSFSSGIDAIHLRKKFSQVSRRPKDFSTRNAIQVRAFLDGTSFSDQLLFEEFNSFDSSEPLI